MNLRSNKNKELVVTEEIGKLERANCRASRISEMVNPIVLVRDNNGIYHDLEGNLRNEQGQKLDAEGNPIVEVVNHFDR